MRFPSDGGWSSCIGARHLLTAGHCVFDRESGGCFQQLIAVPGYDDGHEPFGRAQGTRAISWSGWTQEADFDADLAVVRLDQAIGEQVGWFGFGYHELQSAHGNVVDCDHYRAVSGTIRINADRFRHIVDFMEE